MVAFLTAFLNASILYIYQGLRETPKFSAVCVTVPERIHSGLEMLDLSEVLRFCPDHFLWSLMLGILAVQVGGAHRGWFDAVISDLRGWLGIEANDRVEGLKYFNVVRYSVNSYTLGKRGNSIVAK